MLISIVNTWDAIQAFRPEGHGFGFGLGTIIMLINVVLLWAYTLSCHSCRHIIGGRLRNFSAHPMRYKAWGFVSKLNAKHMQLAWTTLATLMITDALHRAGVVRRVQRPAHHQLKGPQWLTSKSTPTTF